MPSAAYAAKSIGGFVGGAPGIPIGGFFTQPTDVAFWQGADVGDPADDKLFVVERGASTSNGKRVQRLDAEGNFELAFGWDVVATGGDSDVGAGFEVCTVAADCKFPGVVGSARGQFDDPTGIAVDQVDGAVYVYDRDNKRVQAFDGATGEFQYMFGDGVNQTSGGDLCPRPTFSDDLCGMGAGGSAPGQIGPPGSTSLLPRLDIAPATRDVFVADPSNRRVQRFDPQAGAGFDGTPVSTFGAAGTTNPGEFGASQPLHVAVDSAGVAYMSDSTADGQVQRYDSVGDVWLAPIVTTAAGGPLLSGAHTDGLEVDPDSDGPDPDVDSLYVLRDASSGDTIVQQIDSPATVAPPTTTSDDHVLGNAAPNGLGVNQFTADLYVVGALPAGQGFYVMVDGPGPVTGLDTTPAAVGPDTATLAGEIDPGGGLARVQFEIRTNVAGSPWEPVGQPRFVGGDDLRQVFQPVSGLDSNTFYRFRMVVTKQTGVATVDEDISPETQFLTEEAAPTFTTLGTSHRTERSARLRGEVAPNGSETRYRFEYGVGPVAGAFDFRAPAEDVVAGSSNTPIIVHQDIDGLVPSTGYDYRILGSSTAGSGAGDVESFRTKAPPVAAPPTGAARSYELVSPPIKQTGPGLGTSSQNSLLDGEAWLIPGMPSVNGERFISLTAQGAVLLAGASVMVNDHVLAERVSDQVGWVNKSAFNRRNFDPAPGSPQLFDLAATNDDLSLMYFRSTGGIIQFFPEMVDLGIGDSNTEPGYLRDWQGAWELFAPTHPSQGNADAAAERIAIAADGSAAVAEFSDIQGLAGPGDPTTAQTGGSASYVDRVEGGLSDTFPGAGQRVSLGACTAGTEVPERLVDGGQDAQACSNDLISPLGAATVGFAVPLSVRNLVSEDGSRVFFMSPTPGFGPDACGGEGPATSCPPQLYVRQLDSVGQSPRTRWISRTEVPGQAASLMAPVFFEGASADGDKVFFRTTAPLTHDDPNGACGVGCVAGTPDPESWDLYMYDLPDDLDDDPASGDLVRISRGPTGVADGNVAGSAASAALRFVADDGGRLYFTAQAPLPGVSMPNDGTITRAGGTTTTTDATNLYMYENSGGDEDWRFVARIPRAEPGGFRSPIAACASTSAGRGESRLAREPSSGGLGVDGGSNCVRGTPDGSFVTLWTDGRLTDDDPNASTGDVYGYDAHSDELTRLSAPQGGPGTSYLCDSNTGTHCYGDGGYAAWVGNFFRSQLGVATDPGTGEPIAFFQSRSALVREDTDDRMDVYQWRDGRLSLVTVGIDPSRHAFYSGNSADGGSLFFITRDRVTWQDPDPERDAYVARVGGGIPEPAQPPVCALLSGGCHGPGASAVRTEPETSSSAADDDAKARERRTLTVRRLGRKARTRAARTGRLTLRVGTTGAGRVRVVARGRVGKRKVRRLGSASRMVRKAGTIRLTMRLNRAAKRRLGRGRAIRVTLRVSQKGARSRSMTVRLPGAKS